MEKEIKRKPKQYTHIDYEALLVYAMKRHISIEDTIKELELSISRSTVVRNISKIKKNNKNNLIIDLYQNGYVRNYQKDPFPEELEKKIEQLPEKQVVNKPEIEDLYKKLSYMKEIIDICDGNLAEATRRINSGSTILGNVKISRQGLGKNMLHYEEIKKQYQEQIKKESERE